MVWPNFSWASKNFGLEAHGMWFGHARNSPISRRPNARKPIRARFQNENRMNQPPPDELFFSASASSRTVEAGGEYGRRKLSTHSLKKFLPVSSIHSFPCADLLFLYAMQFSSVFFFPAKFRYHRLKVKVIWQEFQSAPDQSSRRFTLSFNRIFFLQEWCRKSSDL